MLKNLLKVQVSITDKCNRKCSFCPHHDPKVFPNRGVFMDTKTARKLATELEDHNYKGLVSISGYGEPTLHPNLFQIIVEFTKRNLKTRLITNGDLLYTNRVNVNIIDNLRLYGIKIDSYDGIEQHTLYQKYFGIKLKKTPYIIANNYDDGRRIPGQTNRAGLMWQPIKILDMKCELPEKELMVDWNGDLIICCNDWIRKQTYGNVNENTLSELWHNHVELNKHRKLLSKGKRCDIEACSNCDHFGISVT